MARTAKKKISIYDEGVLLVDDVDSINFTGSGVGGSVIGSAITENIPGSGTGNEVTGEVVSGSGTTFTLAHTPSGTVSVYANGQRLTLTVDYTIVGAVITTGQSWATGTVLADYSY